MTERTIERLIQSADEATVWKAYKKAEEEKNERNSKADSVCDKKVQRNHGTHRMRLQ